MIYIFIFSNLSDVLKDNERSGKHVQHLKVFLFFNLVYCSIHFTVTLQPFLNTPFLSNKPPRPPFLVMGRRYDTQRSDLNKASQVTCPDQVFVIKTLAESKG